MLLYCKQLQHSKLLAQYTFTVQKVETAMNFDLKAARPRASHVGCFWPRGFVLCMRTNCCFPTFGQNADIAIEFRDPNFLKKQTSGDQTTFSAAFFCCAAYTFGLLDLMTLNMCHYIPRPRFPEKNNKHLATICHNFKANPGNFDIFRHHNDPPNHFTCCALLWEKFELGHPIRS